MAPGPLWPVALLWGVLALAASAAGQDTIVSPAYPLEGQTIRSATPAIVVNLSGAAGDVTILVDGLEADPEAVVAGTGNVTYQVPSILKLREGSHMLEAIAGSSSFRIGFVVNTTVPPAPPEPLDAGPIILWTTASAVLGLGFGAGLYVWGRKYRNFTFRKHFLRHPEQVRYIALYVPSGIAVAGGLAGIFYVLSMPDAPRYAFEGVVIAAASLAVGPFGVATLRETLRKRAYERAFAQLLFELADAVRGGIDPVKALQELAKSDDGLLAKPLRRASDLLRLGRPMDEALKVMTAGMGSPLVSRYAVLVGEASSMGGAVAGVMQRAAKDMDDLVKIKTERRRALRQPVFTMYMAFGVLLLMVLQVVSFAPNIGDINLGLLGASDGPSVPRMGAAAMQSAFYHLLLFNAGGAGLLVGSFTEGRVRNGILHAIVMVAVAAVVYPVIIGAPPSPAGP